MKAQEVIELGNWIRAEIESAEDQDSVSRCDAVRRVQLVRMLGLLKAAEPELLHTLGCSTLEEHGTCVRCQIQALLAEVAK